MNLLRNWKEQIAVFSFIYTTESVSKFITDATTRDSTYFAVCGAINIAMLFLIRFFHKTSLTKDIAKLIFLQMCIQFIGLILYLFYVPANMFYNGGIHAIVMVTYLRILLATNYDGNNKRNTKRLPLRSYDSSRQTPSIGIFE